MSNARKLADNLPSVGQLSNRNLIINGAMQVAQRGTSFTGDGYSLDRIYHQLSGGTSTLTQETFALGSELEGFTKYAKQAVSTGNNYCGIVYKVEDVKSLPQGKATFSFYAKGTNPAAGSFDLKILRMHNGSTTHDTLLDTTVTLTSSWQRFTKTFDVGSLSGMSTPTANSIIYISIRQAGSDTGTAAWELNLTGLQLEVGSQASPFEHEPVGVTLSKCRRYFTSSFQSIAPGNGSLGVSNRYYSPAWKHSATSNIVGSVNNFPVPMRTSPTMTFYRDTGVSSTDGRWGWYNASSWTTGTSTTTQMLSHVGFTPAVGNSGDSTTHNYLILGGWAADAEL